jgi:hypothetical protein
MLSATLAWVGDSQATLAQSLAKDFSVSLYLSNPTDNEIHAVEGVLDCLRDCLRCKLERESPPEYGSWFKKWWWRFTGSEQLNDLLVKLQRALEIKALDLPQAEVDEKLLTSAAQFLQAAGENDVVLKIGSVLLVKQGAAIVVKSLTSHEFIYLDRNPQFLKLPDQILDALAGIPAELACEVDYAVQYEGSSEAAINLEVTDPNSHESQDPTNTNVFIVNPQ